MFLGIVAAVLGGPVIGSLLDRVALRLSRDAAVQDVVALAPPPGAKRTRLGQVATALAFVVVVAVHHDDTARLVLGLAMVCFLVPLTLVDLDTRLLPNALMLPAAVAAIVLGTLLDSGGEVERLVAGLAAGGLFLLTAIAYPRGMGLGDVKLAAVLGLFLGREVAAALLVALVAGVAVGVVIMGRKGVAEGRKTAVPFGPFLALGGVVALLVGEGLVDAYTGSF